VESIVHLTRKSANAKTGPIPVSTSSRASCPSTCAFKGNGCYAENHPLVHHWNAVTEGRGQPWLDFVDEISRLKAGQIWRHNQAGDLQGANDVIDALALRQLARANLGKKGFTYTHYPPTPSNVKAIRAAVKAGFTVNLSADSLADADRLAPLGLPLVVVVPVGWQGGTTPGGRKVTLCPAQFKEYITCATCQLCQKADRHAIVAFEAHGARRKTVARIVEERATAGP
jgi:hypothetical protein